MTLLLQVIVTGLLFGVLMLLLVWLPMKWVEKARKRTCAGCREGTVLFVDAEESLCHKHWLRRDRIRYLERDMDYIGTKYMDEEQREGALDRLVRKIAEMPREMPEEPGAASPKPDGSR